jgi:hypothetical protein
VWKISENLKNAFDNSWSGSRQRFVNLDQKIDICRLQWCELYISACNA